MGTLASRERTLMLSLAAIIRLHMARWSVALCWSNRQNKIMDLSFFGQLWRQP